VARGRPWTDEENQLIAKLYSGGASVEEIAGKLPQGRTVGAVTKQVTRLNLQRGSIVQTMRKSIVRTIEAADVMSREEALKALAAVVKRLMEGGEIDVVELAYLRTINAVIRNYFAVFDSFEKYAELEARMKRMESIVEQIRGKG